MNFYLEWINMLKSHPLNKTGKSKITRKSLLTFDNASIVFCKYYDMSRAYTEGKKTNKVFYNVEEEADVVNVDLFDSCSNLEISDDEETETGEGEKTWYCICGDNLQFKIKYTSVYVHFNDLAEDAWFENAPTIDYDISSFLK